MTNGWGFIDRPCVTLGNAVFRGLIGGTGAKKTITDAIRGGAIREEHTRNG